MKRSKNKISTMFKSTKENRSKKRKTKLYCEAIVPQSNNTDQIFPLTHFLIYKTSLYLHNKQLKANTTIEGDVFFVSKSLMTSDNDQSVNTFLVCNYMADSKVCKL